MTNVTTRLALLIIVAMLSPLGLTQDTESSILENQQLANARALLQMGREDIIRGELLFTESEAAAFWPVYRQYRGEVMSVRDRHAELVAGFLRAYQDGKVSEDHAERLVDDYLDIKGDLLKIQKNYVKQFRKTLPARKVARFYQLENKLDAELEAQLALFVPLIDPV